MIDIVTFKWNQDGFRNKYTAEHVNRLAEMVKRNTTLPYRFVCVTDDPKGIREDVHVIKLWENPAPQYGTLKRPNCFARLKMFAEEAKAQFHERIVWMDLDRNEWSKKYREAFNRKRGKGDMRSVNPIRTKFERLL